jgi:hypothetical protein
VATYALALLLVWSYALLIADNYYDKFDSSEVGELDVCKNMWSCYLYTVNLGLRSGGGIGDVMELYDFNDPKFYSKLILDISFFILINLVCLNISFGIIIDAFSSLIEEQDLLSKYLPNSRKRQRECMFRLRQQQSPL